MRRYHQNIERILAEPDDASAAELGRMLFSRRIASAAIGLTGSSIAYAAEADGRPVWAKLLGLPAARDRCRRSGADQTQRLCRVGRLSEHLLHHRAEQPAHRPGAGPGGHRHLRVPGPQRPLGCAGRAVGAAQQRATTGTTVVRQWPGPPSES